ncbi:macrocin O-methyltransferase [Pseudoflavitalea sp. G-6-1-2]|uniref:TylF/MycF/NovP-related O-methyltransferase n=1 Tax=Pseudoflavitalea sp. G-6-1-2 TaxID=2728841 RepID=UPI00146BFDF8|nr:TylF/MycF/NovP-related O-methyltransferase [Pseudoflavitalea sp. G-6-1-2]NML20008.1 macrocin O-methyltransferase [Pseudoflavitalea sp. G-6-1-2]
MLVRLINKAAGKFGFELTKKEPSLSFDIKQDKAFMDIYNKCQPFTMTSAERMYSLYKAIEYTLAKNIQGDFVECGVWRGGSSMLIALTLLQKGISNRNIYLYDTFEGMSAPTEADIAHSGDSASKLLSEQDKAKDDSVWCYSPIDAVKANLISTGYPENQLHFVKGKVEDTLPHTSPSNIALLRLDTDWYESTKVEMEILYPLLQREGILIIDDFGFWEGARKAVMEYFEKTGQKPFIHRIDDTGRLVIKS